MERYGKDRDNSVATNIAQAKYFFYIVHVYPECMHYRHSFKQTSFMDKKWCTPGNIKEQGESCNQQLYIVPLTFYSPWLDQNY